MDDEPTTVDASDPPPDLDAIAADLAAVESALARLDDGTYWVDPFPRAAVVEEPDPS